MKQVPESVWTIGHSSRSWEAFLERLAAFRISLVADVRFFPASQRHPHFNGAAMKTALQDSSIGYLHLQDLGGRRPPLAGSIHTALREPAFRGYADHMDTKIFQHAVAKLETLAHTQRTAFLCAEADWRHCHRALLSDFLKMRGWKVWHIGEGETAAAHVYTPAARISDGRLRYGDPGLFD